MSIRILVTGGTFDKDTTSTPASSSSKTPTSRRCCASGRSRVEVTIRNRDDDRQPGNDRRRSRVDRAELSSVEDDRIVITHGTDTTDRDGGRRGARVSGKTVVLTGAMIPYAFGSSDGLFNLGSALSFVQVLPPGVYIAMKRQMLSWNRVRKKTASAGEFEEIP